MDENMLKQAKERFYSEFVQLFSEAKAKEKWSKECVETMKDVLKCIYYCEVIMAMKEEEFDGGNESGGSYMTRPYSNDARSGYSSQRRNSMGQFSRTGGYSGFGRRYSYDDERHSAMNRIRSLMESEPNEEVRMALQNAMSELDIR